MRAVGLITEYNPFHNGHAYHVEQARRCSEAEVVVAVMGGHFLQRGEPALVDKWQRARMALSCGVDLVVELPFPWACNSAPHFAAGALEILNLFAPHLDAFCFGSESGDLGALQKLADALTRLEQDQSTSGFAHLRQGRSFPAARQEELEQLALSDADATPSGPELQAPNNILGLAYLRALSAAEHIRLRPLTVTRIGGSFHAPTPEDERIASATAVRNLFRQGEEVRNYVPPTTACILRQARAHGLFADMHHWFMLVNAACLGGEERNHCIYQYQPGIGGRIFAAALRARSYAELVDAVKARHLTRTRVQRMLCYTALEVTTPEMELQLQHGVPFVPLLGATARGEAFLRQCRRSISVPVAGNFSRLNVNLRRRYQKEPERLAQAQKLLELHNRSARIYSLLLPGWEGPSRHLDYHHDPLRATDLG